MAARDVIVVGGGIIGCSVAYALSRAGASVLLVERDRIGVHASRASAGMLTPVTESSGPGALLDLGVESLELTAALIGELRELSGIDPGYRECGVLRVAGPDEVGSLRERASRLEAYGAEWLDADALRSVDVRLPDTLVGALWCAGEAQVDAFLLTRAYAAAAARRGVQLRLGTPVSGLVYDGDRVIGIRSSAGKLLAADVVLCTGAWSAAFEDESRLPIPVWPVKGQMLALEAPDPPLPFILWDPEVYLVPREGAVHVGATIEQVGFDVSPTASGMAALLHGAVNLLPVLGGSAFQRSWAGLRPGSPDGLPLLGPLPGVPGLTLAVGHHRAGVLLSALSGLAVADWIVGGKLPSERHIFDPARFLGRVRRT